MNAPSTERDFRKIEFGKADAVEESTEFPQLLIDGYLNIHDLVDRAINKNTFLFLGYKGAGKTALVEHLLLSLQSHQISIRKLLLAEFPYKNFNKIVAGDDAEAKLPVAWDWILLIYAIDSLSKEESLEILPNEISTTLAALRNSGILPVRDLKEFVTKSSKVSFKVQLHQLFEFALGRSEAAESDLKFLHVVDFLKRVLLNFRSKSNHIIAIDGLDDILTSREIQYQSIAALIETVKSLNSYFRSNSIPVKIIILCRIDLFERLPNPNKNKIRQDSAFIFDWYDESDEPSNSNLIKVANLRGQLVYPEVSDIFATFFPSQGLEGNIYRDLLNFTRHTPRDFMQLLKHIQKYATNNVTVGNMVNGIKNYSTDYFLPEIKDELVGYLDQNLINDVVKLLSILRKRDFLLREAQALIDQNSTLSAVNLEQVFNALFECSAIGHIYRRDTGPNQFAFKFRNRNISFNPNERILLHKGIWRALNVQDA